MTVYVDALLDHGPEVARRLGRRQWCHLTADSKDELHAFARRLGLRREWFQQPRPVAWHYDITATKRRRALELGAVEINVRQLAELLDRRRAAATPSSPSPLPTRSESMARRKTPKPATTTVRVGGRTVRVRQQVSARTAERHNWCSECSGIGQTNGVICQPCGGTGAAAGTRRNPT